ncbi:hypothetical protein N0V83_007456 [Neocucurbitaria cava]|uniref:Uncharacterized protein n=1 Tax=Neocucurbitaria cava TaxID=798079 RepID=A0A9W8Y3E1_9PLEO|nr:hypothetical protein N0V83_007456 [Neocucurbitaria cava]
MEADMNLESAHACSALQALDGAGREQALKGLPAWKELFAAPRWQPVMDNLRRIAGEDKMRLLDGLDEELATPASRPPPLPRLDVASANVLFSRNRAPSTPRARWDVTSSSPVTPLSPTPVGNAFAAGGFWGRLASQPATPVPETPYTAIPPSPWSPIVPRDPEGHAAYHEVKREVDSMALKLCASRLSASSTISVNDHIHPSMVKLRDRLHAAEIIVRSRQVNLQKHLNTTLPDKMEKFAEEEATTIKKWSLKNIEALEDIDEWYLVQEENNWQIMTILEEQRGLLHMNRHRRKSRELKVSHEAVLLAWAVKILEDMEHMVELQGDTSSLSSDEDRGYDYSNFLRSIIGDSVSDLGSTLNEMPTTVGGGDELGSLRSSATTAVSSSSYLYAPARSRGASLLTATATTAAAAAAAMPVPSRLRENSVSVSDNNNPSFGGLKRSNNVATRRRHVPDLSINTTATTTATASTLIGQDNEDEDHNDDDDDDDGDDGDDKQGASSQQSRISPADKVFRHQGPSHADLNNWAAELRGKLEEERRHEMRESRSWSSGDDERYVHPAFRSKKNEGDSDEDEDVDGGGGGGDKDDEDAD